MQLSLIILLHSVCKASPVLDIAYKMDVVDFIIDVIDVIDVVIDVIDVIDLMSCMCSSTCTWFLQPLPFHCLLQSAAPLHSPYVQSYRILLVLPLSSSSMKGIMHAQDQNLKEMYSIKIDHNH